MNKTNFRTIVLTAIITAVVVGGAIFFWQNQQPSVQQKDEVTQTNDQTSTEGAEARETVIIDHFGERITFTPSEEDWCGENCVYYNGSQYVRIPERGDNIFYPEGTDSISESESDEIGEIIREHEESLQ